MGLWGIQISQHVNNSHILREIADYFNPDLKISVHGVNSVQITLGGGGGSFEKKLYLHILLNTLCMVLKIYV